MITIYPPFYDGPPIPIPPWPFVVLWCASLLTPLIGWIFASMLAPAGDGAANRRGAGAIGLVPPGLLLTALLIRFLIWWFSDGTVTGGPAGWLTNLYPLPGDVPEWNLAGVLLLLAISYSAAVLPLALIAGLIHRFRPRTRPFRVPGADIAGPILIFSSVLGVMLMLWSYPQLTSAEVHHLLDLVAIAPLTLVCLAIWTRFSWAPEVVEELAEDSQEETGPIGPDVVALWKSIGALSNHAAPMFVASEVTGDTPESGAPVQAWRNAGGAGAPPAALGELFASWGKPDQGWLVPDLPDPTEQIFLTAALLLAIRENGLPCLVVTQNPERLRDAVSEGIRASGSWSCGPLVAGDVDLRAAFAGGRMPAAAFLDVDQLSAEGIRALAGDLDGNGATWCQNIGLLILSQVDRGDPLSVTHRLFTLLRLGLAMQTAEARWSILATGFGGESTRSMVEKSFPGIPMREVPLGPRASAEVRVWLAESTFRSQPGPPWVKRAADPVVKAGFPVSVGDPVGLFGQRGIEIWGGEVQLIRDVALAGQASASNLNEAWLVASFRALANRIPQADGSSHDALWGLADNPVTRFLTRDQNMLKLHKSGQLKPPRPLFGSANRMVARTHLSASLRECRQSLPALEGAFGRSLVEEVLGRDYQSTSHAVRRQGGELKRVPLAPMQSEADAQTLRGTVTRKVIRLVHAHSGQQLGEVDAVCAATRYYPGRVFSVSEERYEVPPQAFDRKRGQILVEPVPSTQPLTRPDLTIEVTEPVLVEAAQEYGDETLDFKMASFEAVITERVSGFTRTDGSTQRYQAVTSRYRTRVRGVFFDKQIAYNALFHLSRSFDAVLVAHLFAGEEDLEVFPVQPGFYHDMPAGLLVIDRFILGMGAAEALRPLVVRDVLRWVMAILARCKCPGGCKNCTPQDALDRGPDKAGVLAALGHK